MEETLSKSESVIKATFVFIALFITVVALGVSIKDGKLSYAFWGFGFSALVLSYGLSPKFLTSQLCNAESGAFSKKSSNIALLGSTLLLIGAVLEYLVKT